MRTVIIAAGVLAVIAALLVLLAEGPLVDDLAQRWGTRLMLALTVGALVGLVALAAAALVYGIGQDAEERKPKRRRRPHP